ncbi:unnamed protein product [Closterium sp. Yama58-4]|nr:unnamed protein product [Closterium sp. Yama58-4]
MFNFGKPSYAQLGVEAARKPQGDSWARAEGDVDSNGGASQGKAPESFAGTSSNMSAESGRVQVPIGTVSESHKMPVAQALALLAFTAVNVAALVAIFWLALSLEGTERILVIALLGGGWLALLLFNVRMAGRPRRVIQRFLHAKSKTRLGRRLGRGQTVVVRGAVSLLHEELLSTEFHNVPPPLSPARSPPLPIWKFALVFQPTHAHMHPHSPARAHPQGLVLVESSLRSYYPGLRKADAWTEHVRQTRAVDFRITDGQTGMSAIVKAFHAAETGVATPLVHISTEVPLSTEDSPPSAGGAVGGEGGASAEEERKKRRKALSPQLMVCKGYIRAGQTITVMGVLTEEPGTHELLIQPMPQPRNIAKLLLFRGFIPFFFPTWASGLVISDQRDVA